jgi:hypothetical protein
VYPRALGRVVSQNPLYCTPLKLITCHKQLNWYLSEAIQLAYRLLVFGRDFITWLVGKVEGRGEVVGGIRVKVVGKITR